MPITPALSAARMRRSLGVTTEKLANNSVTLEKIQQLQTDKFLGRTTAGTGNPEQVNQFLHMRVPIWTNGGHVTNSASLSAYLDGVIRSNKNCSQNTIPYEIFSGNFSTVTGHIGAVLAPNGKIYCMPQYSIGVIIDPVNNTTTTYGGNFAHPNIPNYGGVLAPNGKIYTIPYTSSYFYVIDPGNNSVTCITTITNMGLGAYHGGVLGPDGMVYCVPSGNTLLRRIDPSSNTVSVVATTTGNQIGATVAPNGKIYCVPSGVTGMLVIDTNNPSVPSYINVSNIGYHTGVITPEGKIYLVPFTTVIGTIVDTNNNSVTTYSPSNTPFPNVPTGSYVTGALAADGKIYLSPWNAVVGGIIDPSTNSFTTWGSVSIFPGSASFHGTVVAPNGKIYFIPSTTTSCVVATPPINNNFNMNVLTGPFRNNTN